MSTSNKKNAALAQQLISGLLFVAVIVMLGWLSNRYKTELDWTAGNRNTLTEASVKQLGTMTSPIRFIGFTYSNDPNRKSLEADIRKYQRVKADITIEFIDPSAQPQKVKDYNISSAGEMVVEYEGRRESLRASTEQAITTALQRLSFAGEKWVSFLEGHGERNANDAQGTAEIGQFAQTLRDKGLKVQSLNLVKTPQVPDNTSVLVLASPGNALLEGELKLIQDYVAAGGNLLWLHDPESPATLDSLAASFGAQWQKGLVIDPVAQQFGLPGGFYVPGDYPPSPITQGFDQVTIFPLAGALTAEAKDGWTVQPLLATAQDSWLEVGSLDGEIALDDKDRPGPASVGAFFTRDHKGADGKTTPQRAVLIGDADFISNQFVGQQGNSDLAVNTVQWLAARDSQLNIDVPKAPDSSLVLPGWGLTLIVVGFLVALPLFLVVFGAARWILRRRK